MITFRTTSLYVALAAAAAGQTPGTLDPSFGTGGLSLLPQAGQIWDVAVQADDKVVAAGHDTGGGFVVRLDADGNLDPTFGIGGRVELFLGHCYDVAVDGSGNILVAGSAPHGPHSDFAVARLTPAGLLDPGFGASGSVVVHMSTANKGGSEAKALQLQADGKILLAGHVMKKNSGSDTDYGIARLLANGSLDPTFGSGGVVRHDVGTADNVWPRAMAIQPDGRIVLGGAPVFSAISGWTLTRYLASGAVDTSFGSGGAFTPTFAGLTSVRLAEVAVQPDGRILAAGRCQTGGNSFDMIVTRHLANGSLDTSFSGDGIALTGLPDEDQGNGLVLQPDGKIVVIGTWYPPGSPVQMMAFRFLGDGTPDASFGTGGRSDGAIFGGMNSAGRAIARDGIGRLVAATYTHFGLARLWGN
ncbi:MAG TPA: hypothetical protein VFZ65_13050 [Planctomycetota bacterium]|nr:hypothetical protein [Planctomycetota bacterium]